MYNSVMLKNKLLLDIAVLLVCVQATAHEKPPHIIFIMSDDMGWNDVGFHGSNEIPTPNIDALAYSGLILNNYYVLPLCTPSRSALMTGKYPIHTGMQHYVLYANEPRGLPLNERLLPEYLRSLGYATHLVGKWHLGSHKREHTPTERGFDTHLGFWPGFLDYFDHTCFEPPYWGMALYRGLETAWDLHGKYTTDVFTDEAVRLIETHDAGVPMFLFLAHAAPHTGNWYNPQPVPRESASRADHVDDRERRQYAGMMMELDDSVGEVVDALRRRGMLEDSVIVFSSDNGGSAKGFNLSAASNWPLRGVKNTLWEGGIRGAALLWSPRISKRQRVANQLMHISDWLPTFYALAGGNVSALGDIDGTNVWDALSADTESNRKTVLHNIDDIYGTAAVMVDEWKLIKGQPYNGSENGWFGPDGRGYSYDMRQVLDSSAGRAVASLGLGFAEDTAHEMRKNAEVNCESSRVQRKNVPCSPGESYCLYNIKDDPCELVNLADQFPEIKHNLENIIAEFNSTAIPPGNLPLDPRGDPKYWNFTWTTYGNFIEDRDQIYTQSVASRIYLTSSFYILINVSILLLYRFS